jgi:AcrR family transcriptional regulator
MIHRKRGKRLGVTVPKRGTKGATTREAILQSARLAFTRSGYDGAGVREIAQGVGVTAMMVNRYFGSKAQLFAEVAEAVIGQRVILTGDARTLSREAAVALAATPARGLDGFLFLLRSCANAEAAAILHEVIERNYREPLPGMPRGASSARRTALVTSFVLGIMLMRQVIRLDALAARSPRERRALEREIEALLKQLIRPFDQKQ